MFDVAKADFHQLQQHFSKRGVSLLRSREANGDTRLTVAHGLFFHEVNDLDEARSLLVQLGGGRDYHN